VLIQHNQNSQAMSGLLYLIAVILIIGWIFGFFVFHVGGGLIHILLVIAIIAVLLRVIRGGRV
jgi:predicted lipid-binding transport protein (Tim44 family)